MKKIFVAGHNGMVGNAIRHQLLNKGNIDLLIRERNELDLLSQKDVKDFFNETRPDEVILAAAKVGGIYANSTFPAEFIYENIQIQSNIIHFSHTFGVQKLLFLGSSCIYPKHADQPIKETSLLAGFLEPTNEPYATAKIAGIKMCESYNRQYGRDYRTVMPTNLFGIGDSYHPTESHVVPGLIRRFHEAKISGQNEVTVWGTGNARRELMYVDDMASASLFIHDMNDKKYFSQVNPMRSHFNIGTGTDISIRELAELIKEIVGFEGKLVFDKSKPDGVAQKLLDISRLDSLGWKPQTTLKEGLEKTYLDFSKTYASKQKRILELDIVK